MAIPTFTTGEPPDGASLGITKVPIRNNLTALAETIAVDHIALNTTDQGKHKFVRMPTAQGSAPATAVGEIALYQKLTSGVNSLYLRLSNNGTELRLTSASYLANQNGYSFIPGGFLLQWGVALLPGGGTVSFNTPFSSDVYNISTTPIAPNAGTSRDHVVGIKLGTANANGFSYNWNGTDSYPAFYWCAIGPA